MATVRYFRIPVIEGTRSRPAYFYETDTGLFDLQYGWGKYTTGMHYKLSSVTEEFRRCLQSEHDAASDGINVELGNPAEVEWEEVEQASPSRGLTDRQQSG